MSFKWLAQDVEVRTFSKIKDIANTLLSNRNNSIFQLFFKELKQWNF